MNYAIDYYEHLPVATVTVEIGTAADELSLHDQVQALIGVDGRLIALDLGDTTMFGDPFDQAAAGRAVAWAREQLAARTAD